jgi:hypothetical protein
MTSPQIEPPAQAPGESLAALAVQIAALRGQIAQINQCLDRADLRGNLDLAARFEELARTVADALDAAAPRGPAAPYWIGLDHQAYTAQLAELRRWADTVLGPGDHRDADGFPVAHPPRRDRRVRHRVEAAVLDRGARQEGTRFDQGCSCRA